MEIPREKLLEMYRDLITARRVDEKLYDIFTAEGHSMHRATGEEAVPVAVCANLRKDDYLHVSPVRGRPCLFCKGLSLVDIIASEIGRDIKKIGGHSSHFCPEYGIFGRSGALGEDVPIYTGMAVSAMIRKTDQTTVYICGDGTANRAPLHESMVMAAAWKLPIVFIIQNNQYGASMPVGEAFAIKDLSDRAKAYGFPGQTVDGNDVIALYEVVKEYVDRTRSGGGPGLIEAKTYRLRGHHGGDTETYRPKGEAEEWWKKDPLPRYQKKLMEMGILTEEDVSKLEAGIKAELEGAAKIALAAPLPTYEDYKKGAIAEL